MKTVVRIVVILVVIVVGWLAYQNRQKSDVNNLAVRLMNDGKYAEALPLLEQAQRADPGNAMVLKNLEICRQELAGNEPDGEAAPPAPLTPADEAALRDRAAARVARMKAEGWADDAASKEDTMKIAQGMIDLDHHQQAIVLLERALFKTPDDLDLERRIEALEAKMTAGQ